jgi:Kelch motif
MQRNNRLISYSQMGVEKNEQQGDVEIFVMGGFVSETTQSIDRFSTETKKWQKYAEMPSQRAKFGLVKLTNGNFMAIGGKIEGKRVSTFEEFSPLFKKWIPCDIRLTSARCGFGFSAIEGNAFYLSKNNGPISAKNRRHFHLRGQ